MREMGGGGGEGKGSKEIGGHIYMGTRGLSCMCYVYVCVFIYIHFNSVL